MFVVMKLTISVYMAYIDLDHDDDISNPFAAEDVRRRLSESDKTKEFMKDQAFLEKLEDLSKSSQNLVNHMADHRVMTALAVLLDVDVTIPESNFMTSTSTFCSHLLFTTDKLQKQPDQDSKGLFDGEKEEYSTSRIQQQVCSQLHNSIVVLV